MLLVLSSFPDTSHTLAMSTLQILSSPTSERARTLVVLAHAKAPPVLQPDPQPLTATAQSVPQPLDGGRPMDGSA